MVNIIRAHFSRYKIVHVLGSFVDPISVDVTDNSIKFFAFRKKKREEVDVSGQDPT